MDTRFLETCSREQVVSILNVLKNNNYTINPSTFKLKNNLPIPNPNELLGVDLFDGYTMNLEKLAILKKSMDITYYQYGVSDLCDTGVAPINKSRKFVIHYLGDKEWNDDKIDGFSVDYCGSPYGSIVSVGLDKLHCTNNVKAMSYDNHKTTLCLDWNNGEVAGIREHLGGYRRGIHRVIIEGKSHMLYLEKGFPHPKYFLDEQEIEEARYIKIANQNNGIGY